MKHNILEKTFTLNVLNVIEAPTDIKLSINSLPELDEEGNPTKELKIEYNVLLKSDQGNVIRISNGKGNIAVSYPAN